MTLAKFQPNRTTGSKVMAKKFQNLRQGTGMEYLDPDPVNKDLIPVEPGNKKSGYLTTLSSACHKLSLKQASFSGFL